MIKCNILKVITDQLVYASESCLNQEVGEVSLLFLSEHQNTKRHGSRLSELVRRGNGGLLTPNDILYLDHQQAFVTLRISMAVTRRRLSRPAVVPRVTNVRPPDAVLNFAIIKASHSRHMTGNICVPQSLNLKPKRSRNIHQIPVHCRDFPSTRFYTHITINFTVLSDVRVPSRCNSLPPA